MLVVGPISSLYDFLTFFVLLHWLKATEPLFHTGWFVESLATQTLVLFVIRTRGNPFRSRPSVPLVATITAVAVLALALPALPIAARLGFTPLPIAFYGFLCVATLTYLGLVEIAKHALQRYSRATVAFASGR
jgi:P-type Mg2+ transporter